MYCYVFIYFDISEKKKKAHYKKSSKFQLYFPTEKLQLKFKIKIKIFQFPHLSNFLIAFSPLPQYPPSLFEFSRATFSPLPPKFQCCVL